MTILDYTGEQKGFQSAQSESKSLQVLGSLPNSEFESVRDLAQLRQLSRERDSSIQKQINKELSTKDYQLPAAKRVSQKREESRRVKLNAVRVGGNNGESREYELLSDRKYGLMGFADSQSSANSKQSELNKVAKPSLRSQKTEIADKQLSIREEIRFFYK